MRIPLLGKKQKNIEKKSNLVQYQNGIYFLGLSGMKGQQRLKNYISGYLNDTVYSCVNLIVQSAVAVPWFLYRKRKDSIEEVNTHPLLNFQARPAIGMTWQMFLEESLIFYLIAGNNYWRKLIGSFRKYGEFEILEPQYVEIKESGGEIRSYRYGRPGAQTIEFAPEEIIHIKTFNPKNRLYGLSKIEILARQIDISNFSQEWMLSLLENMACPPAALSTKGSLTEPQRTALRAMLKQDYSGYENVGNWLILEGDMDVKKLGLTPGELQFPINEKVNMRKICAAFKVAPELFGDSENKTYSNIQEARKGLYQESVIPLLDVFKAAINLKVVPDFDDSGELFFDYDVSGIDALSEDLNAKWTRVLNAKREGLITRGEAREEINYGMLPGPDILTEPISSVPVPVLGKTSSKQIKSTALIRQNFKGGFWQDEKRKEAKWHHFVKTVQSRERALIPIAQKYLSQQASRIRAEIKKAPTISQLSPWALINKKDEAQKFADATHRWSVDTFKHGISRGLAASKGELFEGEAKEGIFTPEQEETLKKLILHSGTKIAETTMEEVMDMLRLAEDENWTIEELTQAINAKLEDFSAARARRIARTESAKIENYAELQGYKKAEFIDYKGWLSAFVEKSRQAHMDADRRYSDNPIPLDQAFEVDNEALDYPGDPHGSPGNIINCLCALFPQVGAGE